MDGAWKWRLYCETEEEWVEGVTDTETTPDYCFHDNQHTIDDGSQTLIDSVVEGDVNIAGSDIDIPAQLKGFQDLARELNLSQEKAQQVVDYEAKRQAEQAEQFVNMRNDWLKEAKADKEIGGAKFDKAVDLAKTAIAQYGSPELTELLETYGLGNHPAVLRAFSRVGADLGEDSITTGALSPAPKSMAERMFPGTGQ